ncbi:retinoblastoma-related protein isoform X2 [Manihot esculenta]|uniref:retinoblastoma-related protein isoform X2 n=1 Tax=Manihot esculenta TaxID=3983 RepID=UPI001CC3EFFD|nr:retinoblastoma-related protein isoform X2 [Manihot esculenta]
MDGSFDSEGLTSGTTDIRGVKRKIEQTDPMTDAASVSFRCSPASPVNGSPSVSTSKTTPSPVKVAEITGNWLRTVISPLPSKPSSKLEQILVVHGESIVDEVIRRANILVTALFPTSRLEQRFITSLYRVNLIESSWSEQRRSEALKLYYRILEAVCESEAQKLNTNDLSRLLANERFHRCLLACSAELVTAAQTGISTLLPAVFERTGITAFDLSKVIGIFIVHEPSLPRELRRHLNSLEEQLLESMVWEKGSSLYDSLIVARPALSDEIHRLGLLAAPMPSIDTIALHYSVSHGGFPYPTILQNHNLSPVKDRNTTTRQKGACSEHGDKALNHISPKSPKIDSPLAFRGLQSQPELASPSLQNATLSPKQSNAQHGGVACSDTAISILFSKHCFASQMTKLAAIRIQYTAERLKLSQKFREKIYFLFQRILTQRPSLFFNRHIDQIIICCFYAVVSKVELTFKQIIGNYRKQPHCRSQFFLFVSSNHEKNGGQDVGIFAFYNKIFLPSVESLLDILHAESPKQVPEKNTDDFPSLHQMSPFPSLPDFSPKKLSPSQNVYLSPLRPSKKDTLNSNVMTKSYYALVGEIIRPYESPSKQLSAINKCLNRAPKARCMLKFDNVDAVMISDSVVAKSLCLQNNYSASSGVMP